MPRLCFQLRKNSAALLFTMLLALLGSCSSSNTHDLDGGSDAIFCSDRLDCPARLGCVDGICGHCARDRDCSVTEFCQPVERLCYPIFVGECTLNQDCDLGWFCVQGKCTDSKDVVPCTSNDQCEAGQRCDQLNLVCVLDLGCNRDEDCAQGEVCDLANHRCNSACTPETADVIGGFAMVCDEFGRCVECYDDQQCGVGLRCNLDTNRCEGQNSCVTDRDCYPGTVCNPQTYQCTTKPPDCLSSADCPDGTICDPPSGRCVSQDCRPDPMEPNDDPMAPSVLVPGRTQELVLCPDDVDWFGMELARGDRLQVIVNTDFLAADHFHIALFNVEFTEVIQQDSLLIDTVATEDGLYRLRATTSDEQAEYSFIVTLSRGVPCDDDDMEPNDAPLTAAPITEGTYGPLAICPRDEDWYVLQRPTDSDLVVRIDYPALDGDLDLDLLAGDGHTLVMRSATAGNSETVFSDNDPGTRFFIRVYGDTQVSNNYEMTVTFQKHNNQR